MKSTIELTATARRQVERTGLGKRIAALALDPRIMKGDFIDIATGNGSTAFVVRSRRLVVPNDGEPLLVFELDFPARPPLGR